MKLLTTADPHELTHQMHSSQLIRNWPSFRETSYFMMVVSDPNFVLQPDFV